MPTLVDYKKVHLNFEILEKFEAGVELAGFEVKSLRAGHASLDGSHVIIRGGEAYLTGAHIPAHQPGNAPKGYDPYQNRRLLLNKKELISLSDAESSKGLTIVPISFYTKGRFIKLSIGIARGKKKFDKREDIKKRDQRRDVEREANARFK